MLGIIIAYSLVGAVAGVLAGLLGIGGGLVIVPMLAIVFEMLGIPTQHLMHMALATSLACIIFNSVSSFMAHHRRGAVDWAVVKSITPGILIGTYLGTCVAAWLPTSALKVFFVVFLYYAASNMLRNKKPKASRQLPGRLGMFATGNVIGAVSSLVGIGGGTLSVPFLVWCNVTIHRAIGTAAAIGLPIALAGTLGYVVNGWGEPGLPDYTLGYVYLPALAGIVCVSVFTAPLGARLAHSLPVGKLKTVFAILLLVVGTRMLIKLLY
ncbi:MAG: sulfite exporter TauE/SafE family protein [Desulfovibrionaceae bacterium]|jgi:uncharacterized membrane protein YfcA|nr:sulfite exporter TauE/SafE family protein [Desulfovibrionaceae bacterium]